MSFVADWDTSLNSNCMAVYFLVAHSTVRSELICIEHTKTFVGFPEYYDLHIIGGETLLSILELISFYNNLCSPVKIIFYFSFYFHTESFLPTVVIPLIRLYLRTYQ